MSISTTDNVVHPSTVLAAGSRGLISTFTLFFSRPVRLFRPVKFSGFTGIAQLAQAEKQSLSKSFLRNLIRREGWKIIPKFFLIPFITNTLSGFILFTTYTEAETRLTRTIPPHLSTQVLVPFLAGGLAGATQSVISTPLDNLPKAAAGFKDWSSLFWEATTASNTAGKRILKFNLIRNGWKSFHLSLMKDSLAFGTFFMVFDLGRTASRTIALAYDDVRNSFDAVQDVRLLKSVREETKGFIKINQHRSTSSLILQSSLILVSGGLAGYSHSKISTPFDRLRQNPNLTLSELFFKRSSLTTVPMKPSRIDHLPYQVSSEKKFGLKAVLVRGMGKVLKLAPIYSVGFLVFAVVSGDLE